MFLMHGILITQQLVNILHDSIVTQYNDYIVLNNGEKNECQAQKPLGICTLKQLTNAQSLENKRPCDIT